MSARSKSKRESVCKDREPMLEWKKMRRSLMIKILEADYKYLEQGDRAIDKKCFCRMRMIDFLWIL